MLIVMTERMQKQLTTLVLKKVNQILETSRTGLGLDLKQNVREFFQLCLREEKVLYNLFLAVKKKDSNIDVAWSHGIISCKQVESYCTVMFIDKQFTLHHDKLYQLLTNAIEIMREVLPLGTVVELDPTYFKPDKNTTSPSKVVITERFVSPKNYQSYFPYVGILYPVGEIKAGAKINFTAPLIKRIIHRGYQDEMEEAFVYLMKQEFIVEKGMNSIEFSNHDMAQLEQEMDLKQKVGDV
ncbi:hypothetical protein CAI16_16415 [Virgibacillus dokdonensis]|uniref:DUF4176 domain-containing protein n=2 Tax=Virgibacillus dokdonensis TaxID=302167 RepID=A0A3E0WL75_9BACI|nr:hypothetical protein CAI16_16415 [Virgibacillus dokdonensis]